ncbi:MAG: hypothetical protein KDD22_02875 [Bdellovibrionales bacterium]|nr:hypothetical protein [Bdellovibrionales bacterium]
MFRNAAILALGILGANAHAYTLCNNGNIEEVGDAYIEIDILEDGVAIMPYEASISLDASQIDYRENVMSVINQPVVMTSEGEASNVLLNAMLILSPDLTQLYAAVSYDQGEFLTYSLTCKSYEEHQ